MAETIRGVGPLQMPTKSATCTHTLCGTIYTRIKVAPIESPIFLKQRAPIVQVVLFGVYIYSTTMLQAWGPCIYSTTEGVVGSRYVRMCEPLRMWQADG
jgi:hypothetical protein